MQSFDEPDAPRAGGATAPLTVPPRPPRLPRRPARGRALLTRLALGVLAASLVFLGLGGAWQALGRLGWLHAPSSPVPQGTTATGLPSSPQGCTLGFVAPRPPDVPIYSARGSPGAQGEVALTFDDGPIPRSTRRILAELKAVGAHATFFDLGAKARRSPDVVRAELAGGNAIGNHTYTHLLLPGASPAVVQDQLQRTTSTIEAITGDRCLWLFRPPYGRLDARVFAEVRREGLTTVLWDVDALDWQRPSAAVIAQRIIAQLHAGAIILLHDWVPGTVAALPMILAAMRARGLRAVTLPRLLRDAGLIQDPGSPAASPGTPTSTSTPAPAPSPSPGSE